MGSNERRLLRNKINLKLNYMANKEAKENNFLNSSQLITVRQQMYMAIAQHSRSKDNSRISKKRLPFPIETSSLPHVNLIRINRLFNSTNSILNNSEEIDKVIKAHSFRIATPYYTNPDLTVERGNFMNYSKHIGALLQTPYYINYLKTLPESSSSKGSQKSKDKKSIPRQSSGLSSNSIRTSACLDDSISLKSDSTIAKTSSETSRSESTFVPRSSRESTSASMSVSNISKTSVSSKRKTESHTSSSLLKSSQCNNEMMRIVLSTNDKKDERKKPRDSKKASTPALSITKSTSSSYKSKIRSSIESRNSSKLKSCQSKDDMEDFRMISGNDYENSNNILLQFINPIKEQDLTLHETPTSSNESNKKADIIKVDNDEKLEKTNFFETNQSLSSQGKEKDSKNVKQINLDKSHEVLSVKCENNEIHDVKCDLTGENETFASVSKVEISKSPTLSESQISSPKMDKDKINYSQSNTDTIKLFSSIEDDKRKQMLQTDLYKKREIVSQNIIEEPKPDVVQYTFNTSNEKEFLKYDENKQKEILESYYDQKQETLSRKTKSNDKHNDPDDNFYSDNETDEEENKVVSRRDFQRKDELLSQNIDEKKQTSLVQECCNEDYEIIFSNFDKSEKRLSDNCDNKTETSISQTSSRKGSKIKFPKFWVKDPSNIYLQVKAFLKEHQITKEELYSMDRYFDTVHHFRHTRPAYVIDYCLFLNKQNIENINIFTNIFNKDVMDSITTKEAIEIKNLLSKYAKKLKDRREQDNQILISTKRNDEIRKNEDIDTTQYGNALDKQSEKEAIDNYIKLHEKNNNQEIPKNKVDTQYLDEDDEEDFSVSFQRLFRNSITNFTKDDVQSLKQLVAEYQEDIQQESHITDDNEDEIIDFSGSFCRLFRNSSLQMNEDDIKAVQKIVENISEENQLILSDDESNEENDKVRSFRKLFRASVGKISESDLRVVRNTITNHQDINNEKSELLDTKQSKNILAFKDLFRNSISSIKENDLDKINKIIEEQEKTMTDE